MSEHPAEASKRGSIAIEKAIEAIGLRKDGSQFPIEVYVADWRTRGGIFFTAIIRDICERKQTKEMLEKQI